MGVYVNFDGWGDIHGSRHKLNQGFDYCWGFDDFFRLAVVAKLLEKGYAEKIMFGHDKYNKLGGFYGGAYGYTRFPTFAIPALREMGYEKEAQLITVANFLNQTATPQNKVSTILCDRKKIGVLI